MNFLAGLICALLPWVAIPVEANYTTTCPCGWTNEASNRITGGTDALDQEYPFMAAIYRTADGKKWKKEPVCGGTVITSSIVLTAAHCVDDDAQYSVLVGITDLSTANKSDLIAVTRIDRFGSFNTNNYLNDIALLTLNSSLDFTEGNIGPVCLPQLESTEYITPSTIRVLGWGKPSLELSGRLQEVDTAVLNFTDCSTEYHNIDSDRQFCTHNNGKGPSQGDSGGPALWWDEEINAYTLLGVVSMGPADGFSTPVVYTQLQYSLFLYWIQELSNDEICSKVVSEAQK